MHHIYATQHQSGENQDLETMLSGGLENEVAMLATSTRSMLRLAAGMESSDEAIAVLGSLGASASRLAGLLKVQKRLTGENPRLMAAISKALADVLNEMVAQGENGFGKRRVRKPVKRRNGENLRTKPAVD